MLTRITRAMRRQMVLAGQLLLIMAIFVAGIFSSPVSPVAAASIAQGYTTQDSELVVGMAAAFNSDINNEDAQIERSSLSNIEQFVGIVTTKDANLVTITSSKANVVVATSGLVQVFASDTNGSIKRGDKLTISPMKGILMRSANDNDHVFGTAREDFNTTSATPQEGSAFDGSGRKVLISNLTIELNSQSIVKRNQDSNISFLRALGQSVTGKTLREWQVVTALIIFVLILIVEGALVFGAIHSTISALGRNPLAKDAVFRQLLQVVMIVLSVLAFGFATIYAILQI